MKTRKNDDPKCAHIHTQKGKALTQAYPEDRITHSKGARAHSRISRSNHSPKESEGIQSQEVSLGDVSTEGEGLQSQARCSRENHLRGSLGGAPCVAWLDLNCSHFWLGL